MDKMDYFIDRLVEAYSPAPQAKEMIRQNIINKDYSVIRSEVFYDTADIFGKAFAVLKRNSGYSCAEMLR
ncbi:MAG: hypothetical protein GX041_08710 [Clostridiales bacterium]|jgi:hypothetical protein|nr:hypothetical protein [Clostridiales bacterium]